MDIKFLPLWGENAKRKRTVKIGLKENTKK